MYDATRCVPTPTFRPLPLSLHNIRNGIAHTQCCTQLSLRPFLSDFQCATVSVCECLYEYSAQLPTATKFA